MCGIIGIFSKHPVAAELYDSLIHLQHRGQDAAGIMTCEQRFYSKHGMGLVREIFSSDDMPQLPGKMGIAHTRYPTAGNNSIADVQPFWIGHPYGIALAHNGNLFNYEELKQELLAKHRHLNSSSDSEVLLHLLADGLDDGDVAKTEEKFFEKLCHGVGEVFKQAKGAYSVVSMVIGKGLIAFRDPHGIRPLVMGERNNGEGTDYAFASEPTMFYSLDYELTGNVEPGELIFIASSGKIYRKQINVKTFTPCIFEYVYFSRPDAKLDEVSVYRARLRMGQNLAKKWQEKHPNAQPDIVIPAPFTANTAALSFAHEIGVRYSEGLYKNPFVGRTFIMPNHAERKRAIRYKLSPQETEIRDKVVLIVDDSIVRGTTSREIVRMVREYGAKKIYFVSAAPEIKNPCFYGVDIPNEDDLIAHKMTLDEIKDYIGVDLLMYQSQEDLIEAVTRKGEHHIEKPCLACMDGCYMTGGIDDEKKKQLAEQRKST
jgi:amidophosphoribosyltransferase